VVGLAVLVLAWAALEATAAAPGSADSLRGEATELGAAEQRALLRLYAAETAAARARADLERSKRRLDALTARLQTTRRHLAVAQRSHAVAATRVSRALRALYLGGPPPDALAVILSAESFDDALDGVESLRLAVGRNHSLALAVGSRSRELRLTTNRLAATAASARKTQQRAIALAAELAGVVTRQEQYVASLRARRAITEERLSALQRRAEEAARRTRVVEASAAVRTTAASGSAGSRPTVDTGATAAPAAEPPVSAAGDEGATAAEPSGGSRLTVETTAYALRGTTASGLPVGPGIIAVDPNVIPLGTRVYVPGYGEAVAADTGSAVKGNIIDLWMPSTSQALQWGRRTVTITVYRS